MSSELSFQRSALSELGEELLREPLWELFLELLLELFWELSLELLCELTCELPDESSLSPSSLPFCEDSSLALPDLS